MARGPPGALTAAFEIALTSDGPLVDGTASEGLLRIGGTEETFIASHIVWNPDQYLRHWVEAAARLINGEPSCFMTDVAPRGANYRGERWNAWPEGGVVTFQNQILVGDVPGFDLRDPYASLPPAAPTRTSSGAVPSTWRVPLVEIADWYRRTTASSDG